MTEVLNSQSRFFVEEPIHTHISRREVNENLLGSSSRWVSKATWIDFKNSVESEKTKILLRNNCSVRKNYTGTFAYLILHITYNSIRCPETYEDDTPKHIYISSK